MSVLLAKPGEEPGWLRLIADGEEKLAKDRAVRCVMERSRWTPQGIRMMERAIAHSLGSVAGWRFRANEIEAMSLRERLAKGIVYYVDSTNT